MCHSNDDCDVVCLFERRSDAAGVCRAECVGDEQCPNGFECVEGDNLAGRWCLPIEDQQAGCEGACQEYGFFECIDDGQVATCLQACSGADNDAQGLFAECSERATLDCGTGCLEALAPDADWDGQSDRGPDGCTRVPELDGPLCMAFGDTPPNGYRCPGGTSNPACVDAGLGEFFCCP